MKLKIEDFKLPEELERYRTAVKEFVQTELEPIAEELEDTNRVPDRLLPLLREAGLLRLRLPQEYGGIGLTFSQYWPILEEVAKSHGTIRMFVHGYNGIWVMIGSHGTEEQKRKYFPIWTEGRGFPVFALTEPGTGTGVDIKTTARKEGNIYRLNGRKHLITFADIAEIHHVVAYTGDRSLGSKGISMFIVEKGSPGFTIEPHKEMLGNKGCYHGILHFNDCEVPAENLLGQEGEGLDIALRVFLDISRLSIAVSCLGCAQRLLELSSEYSKERVTFGKPISERQAVQQMLADMATDVYALRCMIADCARKYDEGQQISVQSSMCKLFGLLAARRVSDMALEIHGGIGVTQALPIERLYRDTRCLAFEEGTPTIQRLVIGRQVLGKSLRSIERQKNQKGEA